MYDYYSAGGNVGWIFHYELNRELAPAELVLHRKRSMSNAGELIG